MYILYHLQPHPYFLPSESRSRIGIERSVCNHVHRWIGLDRLFRRSLDWKEIEIYSNFSRNEIIFNFSIEFWNFRIERVEIFLRERISNLHIFTVWKDISIFNSNCPFSTTDTMDIWRACRWTLGAEHEKRKLKRCSVFSRWYCGPLLKFHGPVRKATPLKMFEQAGQRLTNELERAAALLKIQ